MITPFSDLRDILSAIVAMPRIAPILSIRALPVTNPAVAKVLKALSLPIRRRVPLPHDARTDRLNRVRRFARNAGRKVARKYSRATTEVMVMWARKFECHVAASRVVA